MPNEKSRRDGILTNEETNALSQPIPAVKLSSYGEALSNKTRRFKVYFFVISALGALYLLGYALGGLDLYIVQQPNEASADGQLRQLRFIAGFVMLVLLHTWLLMRQPLETLLMCFAALLTYFMLSRAAHFMSLGNTGDDFWPRVIYVALQMTFVLLPLLLILEERRSLRRMWQ